MKISVPIDRYHIAVAGRPPGYETEIAPAIVDRTATAIMFEDSHPAYTAAQKKYAATPKAFHKQKRVAQVLSGRQPYRHPDADKWGPIHTKIHPTQQWLDELIEGLRCGECRQEAKQYIRDNPPDFQGWFTYSVAWHNAVNRRLGKREWMQDAARRRWFAQQVAAEENPAKVAEWVERIRTEQPADPHKHWGDLDTWKRDAYVQAAHMQLWAEAIAQPGEYPPSIGRGIVICGGGRFFPSAYITIRVARHVGCTLPVELWYFGNRGEREPWMQQATAGLNVTWIDIDQVRQQHPARNLNGWEAKWFAVRWSRFREVLSLDADSYPIRDPEYLFDDAGYRQHGAMFFPDKPSEDLKPYHWQAFGMQYRREPAIESGQFVVDRERCWRELAAAWWLNNHSEYFFSHVYGDKESGHLAWRKCGTDYAIPAKRWEWRVHTMIQHDPAGKPLFYHRCRGKFVLPGVDGRKQRFMTRQEGFNVRDDNMEHEAFCWQSLAELAEIAGASAQWK